MGSTRLFTTMQVVLPGILPHLEKLNPDLQQDLKYNIYCNSVYNAVEFNLVSSKFPSTLFWIDENFNIMPYTNEGDEKNADLVKQIQQKMYSLLKCLRPLRI